MEKKLKDAVVFHAAMMETVDTNVGRVIETLESLGELDNTLIFYLSDNGARAEVSPLLNKPYRGAKALLWEGGQKTACIAFWPDRIRPGQLTDAVGWVGDFLPTVLEVAGVSYPENFRGRKLDGPDGRSLLPALMGDKMEPPMQVFTTDKQQTAVIQDGRWKLLINPGWTGFPAVKRPDPTRYELYDLKSDPAETANLAEQQPGRVKELETLALRLQKEQGMMDYFELEKIDPDRTRF
jgi:arylsulfatase